MAKLTVTLILLVACAGSASAWRVDVRAQGLVSEDAADGVAVLPGGDAIVVGDLDCDPTALRIDRDTGNIVWRTEIATFSPGCPTAIRNVTGVAARLAVAGDDAVVVAPGGLVVKLDTATGAERWRHQVEGYGFGVWLSGLVVDPAGSVMVAGSIAESDSNPASDFLVAALDGATGVERWRQVRNGTPGPPDPDDVDSNGTADVATAIALDAAGNALVAGSIERRGVAQSYLFQLAGDSGAERWSRRIRHQLVQVLAVDELADEVVVAGMHEDGESVAVQRHRVPTGARRWRKRVPGMRAGGPSLARDLVVAPDGDAYLAAVLPADGSGYEASVVRLAASRGRILWTETFPMIGNVFAEPLAVALDGTGSPVVTGRLADAVGTASPVVVGLRAGDGSVRWRRGPAKSPPDETALRALAAAGTDIVAVGAGRDRGSDVLALRLAAGDGSVRWERLVDGGAADADDAGFAVATLPDGDVVAAGGLEHPQVGSDFAVVRLAGGSGAERWRAELTGARAGSDYSYDVARCVAVDPSGDVVAAGFIEQPATDWDLAVAKLDGTTGIEQWRVLVAGTAGANRDVATGVTTDAAGDVVVVGYLFDRYGLGYDVDFFVLKLDGATGAERWRHIVPLAYGQPFAVRVDPSGDVVAAGVASTPATGADFVVVKLAGDSGVERWRASLNGTSGAFEGAHALALAADGDVLAAGYLSNTGTSSDWTVVRLAGDSGAERWRQVFDGAFHGEDSAEALATDPAGDVLVAGSMQVAAEGWDVVLQRLDGANGAARWPADLCSGPGRLTQALGIDLSRDGSDLRSDEGLWIEERRSRPLPDALVAATPRIGVAYAGSWARRRLRFLIRGHPCVSPPRAPAPAAPRRRADTCPVSSAEGRPSYR